MHRKGSTVKFPRRKFLHLAAGAAALPAVSRIASAQTYPTKPVRLIVGFAPGGPTDIVARLIGQWLSQRLGQPFIVENRPGAIGNIATEAVVRAPADGHTLLLVNPANAVSATLYENLKFNFIRNIAPVAGVARVPYVMVVHPSVPAKTVSEFIAFAKGYPGKINFASAGTGTVPHVAAELFKIMTSIDMVHVPYRGNALALADLLGGQVQMMFVDIPSSLQYIRGGTLRAVAMTIATRWEALPDLPTVADVLPGFEASSWYGIGAPSSTPTEIIDKLNGEINGALADNKMKARLDDLGATSFAGSPSDFGRHVAEETESWGKVVKLAGLKPE
jgi:tripartite-type tricarboxylate transporter receptor subunit TctC